MSRDLNELHDTCDKACEILKKTKDGDLLDPQDLKMTEYAVNGWLNEEGREIFEKLYKNVVIDGTYVKPYLHGIEHITRDHDGYIYYKGNQVEHYNSDYVYTEVAKNDLLELKRRCDFLERKGAEISSITACWAWNDYAAEYSAERLKALDAVLGDGAKGLFYSLVEVYCLGRTYEYFVCGKPADLDEVKDHPVTQSLIQQKVDDEYEVKIETFVYDKNGAQALIPQNEIANKAEIESLLHSVHSYLKDEGRLAVLQSCTQKTDFAENYEKTKELERLLNSPGSGLEYSAVDLWSVDNHTERFFMYGTPTLDEIKRHEVYNWMAEVHGVKSVSATTFVYGYEPLSIDRLPPIEKTEELLHDIHDYLEKNELSKETRWENYSENLVVNRRANSEYESEQEDEAEDGYEP